MAKRHVIWIVRSRWAAWRRSICRVIQHQPCRARNQPGRSLWPRRPPAATTGGPVIASDLPRVVLEHPHSPDPWRRAVPGLVWRASSGPWPRRPARGDSARPSAGRDLCWPSWRGRRGAQRARRIDALAANSAPPFRCRSATPRSLLFDASRAISTTPSKSPSALSRSARDSLIPVSAGFAACSC